MPLPRTCALGCACFYYDPLVEVPRLFRFRFLRSQTRRLALDVICFVGTLHLELSSSEFLTSNSFWSLWLNPLQTS